MEKNKLIIIFVCIGIFLFTVNVVFLKLIDREDVSHPVIVEQSVVLETEEPVKRKITGELTRRMRRDPSRAFFVNIIFSDGQEVARFKSDGEKVFDVEGSIPDGKISFENVSEKTYGNEYFFDGQRDGLYQEYLNDGRLRFEKNYARGKVMTLKEFFDSGSLRMEVDYRDALWIDDDETGKGRVFLNNGILIYEWHMTMNDPNRYKKAYNHSGDLVEVRYFDSQGKLVSQKQIPR